MPVETDHAGYERTKTHYQADEVAATYDAVRWSSLRQRWSNQRDLHAITKAIAAATALHGHIRNALDIPCGTGRIFSILFSHGIRVTEADLSLEMMRVARGRSDGAPFPQGYIRCDVEALPFQDDIFDAVLSIRFLLHLATDIRRTALKEMARVSRRWVILDYRHRYTLKYWLKRLQWRLGLTPHAYRRLSRRDIEEDFKEARLDLVRIFPVFPLGSDKWMVLGRKIQ